MQRLRRVSLTGDVAGDYVVLEERPDRSLVIAPDTSRASDGTPEPPAAVSGTRRILRLFGRSEQHATSVPELLAGWGIQLHDDELVDEFMPAEVDGRPGFLTVTSRRLIFVAESAIQSRQVQEHALVAVRDVELRRHGTTSRLHVSADGSTTVIGGVDRASLARLEQRLSG
jgi:hypothetical protein